MPIYDKPWNELLLWVVSIAFTLEWLDQSLKRVNAISSRPNSATVSLRCNNAIAFLSSWQRYAAWVTNKLSFSGIPSWIQEYFWNWHLLYITQLRKMSVCPPHAVSTHHRNEWIASDRIVPCWEILRYYIQFLYAELSHSVHIPLFRQKIMCSLWTE